MRTVIFVCTDNAGLSPIAELFFNSMVGRDNLRGVSAGLRPAERIHQGVVQAMLELGITLSRKRPRLLTPEAIEATLIMVTLGAEQDFANLQYVQREHWHLEEVKDMLIGQVRETRNAIEKHVRHFVTMNDWMKSTRRQTREWAPSGL